MLKAPLSNSTLFLWVFAASLIWLAATAIGSIAGQAPGRIIGNLDGISQDGDHFFISGWACQQGQNKSLTVHVYGADPKTPSQRLLLIVQFADLYSEPAIAQACQDSGGGGHRFVIMLPHGYGPENLIWVNGIRLVEGVANDAVAGSGQRLTRLPLLDAPHPDFPRLSGAYRSLAAHPRVFMTASDLKDLVTRINRPGSYSGKRFALLADQIKRDLGSGIEWEVTYSGCDGWVYQYVFSYEPQDHHEAEIRAALKIAPGVKAPTGGAVVASRLALYAALVKAGATLPPGAPRADAAAEMAKRILLAWADRGFLRDDGGQILPLTARICGPTAKNVPSMTQPRDTGGLGLGRGVLYSVQAQDLLQYVGNVDVSEQRRLDAMHGSLFDLLRQSANQGTGSQVYPYPHGYNNITAHFLASVLATARLLDDAGKMKAVLYGGDPASPLLLSWTRSFDRLIYGEADHLPNSGANHFRDSLTSLQHAADFQLPNVAPGEIADRGRNANAGQGIGYPMITLGRLFDGAEILRVAGFDPYGYRGLHKQSLEMATQYYSCLAQGAGFYKIVTAENSRSCPNAAQYYGKLVSGVDGVVLIGAYRFPENAKITALESSARMVAASPGAFTNDAILFGKWRD